MTIEIAETPSPVSLVDRRRRSKLQRKRKEEPIPPIYCAIVLEIERRRQACGISMDEMSELMGTAERAYAKMLYPETSSGRVARWETVQKAVDVLFCDGFRLHLERSPGPALTTEGTRRKILASAAFFNRATARQVMAERGRKGGIARAAAMSPEERRESARKAGLARAQMKCMLGQSTAIISQGWRQS
jgi:hypothetical protein